MKLTLFAALALAASFTLPCAAQDAHDPLSAVPPEKHKQRLESFRFDIEKWSFYWSVSEGYTDDEGKYQITKLRPEYEIRLEEARMLFEGEARKFSPKEAENVSQLFALVARYALESTVWWEKGEGEPAAPKKDVARTEVNGRALIRSGRPVAAFPSKWTPE